MVFIEKNKKDMTFSNALRQNERQVMCIEKNLFQVNIIIFGNSFLVFTNTKKLKMILKIYLIPSPANDWSR